jgi:WD40 repeat protein
VLSAGGQDDLVHFWTTPAAGSPITPDIDIFSATAASLYPMAIAFDPVTSQVAVGSALGGSLSTWNLAPPRPKLAEYDTNQSYDVLSVAYSTDGKWLVGGQGDCACIAVCND